MERLELLPTFDLSCGPRMGLFDRLFEESRLPVYYVEDCSGWRPASDISETKDEYVITAELPGIDMKALDVSYSNGILTLKGEKKKAPVREDLSCSCAERYAGSFERSFRIVGGIKEDEIDASYKDGVLTLVLPKREDSRKIEVH